MYVSGLRCPQSLDIVEPLFGSRLATLARDTEKLAAFLSAARPGGSTMSRLLGALRPETYIGSGSEVPERYLSPRNRSLRSLVGALRLRLLGLRLYLVV